MVLGWPKKSKLAHAFLWGCRDKGLKLAQSLGQLGIFLAWARNSRSATSAIRIASSAAFIAASASAIISPRSLSRSSDGVRSP